MIDDSHAAEALPPEPTPVGWFEPTPEKLIEQLPAIKARYGEESIAYATKLVQIGDAHMVQGCLSNPQAQARYEAALKIVQAMGEQAPEAAWIHDKLAAVKHSSGDSFGAAEDLEKAVCFWKEHPPVNKLARCVPENHVARREEDLDRLRKLNVFLMRKPPGI